MLRPARDYEWKPMRWDYSVKKSNDKSCDKDCYKDNVIHFGCGPIHLEQISRSGTGCQNPERTRALCENGNDQPDASGEVIALSEILRTYFRSSNQSFDRTNPKGIPILPDDNPNVTVITSTA
jgi:hypothetical protein